MPEASQVNQFKQVQSACIQKRRKDGWIKGRKEGTSVCFTELMHMHIHVIIMMHTSTLGNIVAVQSQAGTGCYLLAERFE